MSHPRRQKTPFTSVYFEVLVDFILKNYDLQRVLHRNYDEYCDNFDTCVKSFEDLDKNLASLQRA